MTLQVSMVDDGSDILLCVKLRNQKIGFIPCLMSRFKDLNDEQLFIIIYTHTLSILWPEIYIKQ